MGEAIRAPRNASEEDYYRLVNRQQTTYIIITFLQWEKHHNPSLHLSEEQMIMLEEQRNKTVKLFQFTATSKKQQRVSMGRSAIHLLETQHGSQPR